MIKYDFVFNHKKASELNIRVTERPSIPAAQKNIEEINMENMDGSYYMEDGTYNDIQITLSCNFRSPEYAWNENVRAVKEWLHGFDYAGNHLVMNDDPDYFFKVKKVETSDFDRVYKQIGKFTVTFTCEGFQYYTRGTVPILCDGTLYNDGAMCKPTYILTDTTGEGKGVVRLFVNVFCS